jgi:hypothetical protein
VPFAVYAYSEAFLKPISTCANNPNISYLQQCQKHVPSSYAFCVKGIEGIMDKCVAYTTKSDDDDVMQLFFNNLAQTAKYIYNKFGANAASMIFNKEDGIACENSTHCHMCGDELNKLPTGYKAHKTPPKIQPEKKVRNRCHVTGKFRGAAHSICNLNYKLPKFYPVIMHNLSGYNAHLLVKKLNTISDNISCIPNTDEKCISFRCHVKVGEYTNDDDKVHPIKRELGFIDSLNLYLAVWMRYCRMLKSIPMSINSTQVSSYNCC